MGRTKQALIVSMSTLIAAVGGCALHEPLPEPMIDDEEPIDEGPIDEEPLRRTRRLSLKDLGSLMPW